MDTRKELRTVQLDLRKDVEKLGVEAKFINIGLVPLVVAALALGLGAFRIAPRSGAEAVAGGLSEVRAACLAVAA